MSGQFIKQLHYEFKYEDPKKRISGSMVLNLDRFEGQFSRAQYLLDSTVMQSMIPYMPMQTGNFISVTKGMSDAIAGSGKVVAAAPPMGRFLYEGLLMVDELTGSAYARKGAKKVLAQGPVNLQFSKHANKKVTAHWFEAAKKDHGSQWVKAVKHEAGGGTRG